MVVAFVVTTAAKGSGSNRVGGLNIHIYSDTVCEPGWKLGSPSSSVEQWFPVGIFVCLLSVFNLAEAVDVCESHAQCQAFVVTNQTTWTGEPMGRERTS